MLILFALFINLQVLMDFSSVHSVAIHYFRTIDTAVAKSLGISAMPALAVFSLAADSNSKTSPIFLSK